MALYTRWLELKNGQRGDSLAPLKESIEAENQKEKENLDPNYQL